MASTPVPAGTQSSNTFQTLYPAHPQKINFSSSSVQSSAFQSSTSVIRIFSTKDCYIKLSSNPTATSNDIFVPSDIIQFFGVEGGTKLAVIRDSEDGVMHIIEGAVT